MSKIKIVDFTSEQSWAILPSKMVRRLNRIYCVVTSVCVFRFVCHREEIQRLRKYQFESNSFANLSRISDKDIMEEDQEDVEESLTQADVTRWCHVTFWPRDSNAIFEGKIAQLCALVKSTIFVVGNSNFEIVYFKRHIFILCGKHFRLIGTLMKELNNRIVRTNHYGTHLAQLT